MVLLIPRNLSGGKGVAEGEMNEELPGQAAACPIPAIRTAMSGKMRMPASPNVYGNRHPSAQRLGVQRPKGAGLNMLLGRLAKPDPSSIERTICKAYHLRSPERDAAQG